MVSHNLKKQTTFRYYNIDKSAAYLCYNVHKSEKQVK